MFIPLLGPIKQRTIHILRNHIFKILDPPSPLRNHVFSTENNKKLAFSDPPPPLQVIMVINMQSTGVKQFLKKTVKFVF